VIHVAAHAMADARAPGLSGILLAADPRPVAARARGQSREPLAEAPGLSRASARRRSAGLPERRGRAPPPAPRKHS